MEKKYVIGVDVGGQSAKCGVVDVEGNVVAQEILVSNETSEAAVFIAELADTLKKLIAKAGVEGQIAGIGVGAPNANYYTGNIEFAPNLTWTLAGSKIIPFAKMLSEAMGGLKVTLTNDANAAALGEMKYGVAKLMKIKDFIMITLGTGVGSGIVINGQLLYGHDGFAGELGHTIVVRENGRQCGCGRKGCLEAYCSAIGVARTAKEWLEESEEPSLLRSKSDITSKDVYDAAKDGDALAKRVFDYTGRLLGTQLADFIAFSAPEAIILFGGLARAKEFLTEPIEKAMNDNVLPLWKNKVKLLYSTLPASDAAILGASALGWE